MNKLDALKKNPIGLKLYLEIFRIFHLLIFLLSDLDKLYCSPDNMSNNDAKCLSSK